MLKGGAKDAKYKNRAIKRVKVAEKKTKRNNMIKSECKTAIRKYETANSNGDAVAVELLSKAKSKIIVLFKRSYFLGI